MSTTEPTQPPEEDPVLRRLGIWEMRIMKIAVIAGLIIFAGKHLWHEVQSAMPAPTSQEQQATSRP